MSIDNTQNTLNAIIDKTLAIIDNGIHSNVGDMTLMQAMEFVGVLMDIRASASTYEACTEEGTSMWKSMYKNAQTQVNEWAINVEEGAL